jgi:hypothetical protein
MKIFEILDPFFHALNDKKIIRQTVEWVLRVLAVIMALLGLYGCVSIIRLGINARTSIIDVEGNLESHTSIGILIGCILLALFVLTWGYLTAGVFAVRARSVKELEDSHFTVLSVISLLLRINGELAFITYTLLGVGGCLFVWITGNTSPRMGMLGELPFAGGGSTGFVGGLETAIFFQLVAFSLLVFFYALAEFIAVQVAIESNTRGLRKAS